MQPRSIERSLHGNKKAITDPSQPSIPAREPKESESEHRQVTARGRGRKNLGRGRSSLVIVNEGSGSFSGKPYFQGEPMGVAFFHVGISPAVRYRSSPGFLYDSSVLSIPSSRGRRRVKARKVGWEPNKTSQALSLVRPFTRVNTETDNSRCPQTDATNKVKDKIQYSWIGKTNSHSRKRTVDDSRPGRTDATNKVKPMRP
ncbi:hypothetical protein RIF29_28996 [Crotalaria pallida]|uniref:Uncharacterized protein n=1 Tax=Crotalaria pallida TaxID=3830 RepID=A0AAN9EE66_CROPI